ncbi:dipeptide epimerase [Thalassotalea sp. PP2-459]|uniref:dipeptide epimerase n=1 Tax=Thalassotalea sp. PP2-459 TaxID=1742724 RepID=UPI000942E5F0|nr:dipeptide epimerase [Thalassotalea sp. PP2-459]OKY25189.1 dipeptide epimerase [Thalassotalea sp. PP2-459]
MKITNIRFAKLVVPLITPFKTSMRTVENIEDLVVIIETDAGEVGYGSAPSTPVITGDTHGSIIAAVELVYLPKLRGMEIENLNGIITIIQTSMVNNTSAKAALEIAIYDLWGKKYKAPLSKLLGGGANNLRTDITISVDQIDKMVKDAMEALENGFDILKIKIGHNILEDVERVKAIHQAVGEKALLRLDVNQGWSAKQTVYAANLFENAGIQLELIEQPVKADDFAGLKYISDRINTPIMADESAFSPTQVIELITNQCVDIINIKLMKTGGISKAITIADIAKAYQVDCMIGCMLEGSIAVAAAAHLAVAKSTVITKIDLDGPALGRFDPVKGGVLFDNSLIKLNNLPGLGIESIDGLIKFQ